MAAAGPRLRSVLPAALAVAAALAFAGPSDSQTLRPEFWVPNGTVNAAAIAGNTLYIAGDFSWVAPQPVGWAKVDSVTGGPLPVPEVFGTVWTAEPDGAGGWYLGGAFTAVKGVPRQNLAHLDAAGNVTPWNPGVGGVTNFTNIGSLKRMGDTVYVGGQFTSVGGIPRRNIASVHAITGAVTSFDPSPNGPAGNFIVTPTLLYTSGSFDSIGGVKRTHLACVNRTTGVTTTFNPGFDSNDFVYSMQLGNGKVYLAGFFDNLAGNIGAVDSVTGGGTAWNNFGANGAVNAMILDGPYLYVGGSFTFIGGQFRYAVARLSATNGTCDPDWFGDSNGTINHLAKSGNTLYASGTFGTYGGASRQNLAALDVTTGLATPWTPVINDQPGMVVVPGGLVLLTATSVGGVARANAAAFDLITGALTAWNPFPSKLPNSYVNALAVRDNVVYLATDTGVQACDGTTGATKPWFVSIDDNTQITWDVKSLALAGDTLYVGGSFFSLGGQPRFDLGQICVTNGAVGPWNPNPSANGGDVKSISLCGSTLYVAGDYTSLGGVSRAGLGAISTATGVTTSWNPNPVPAGSVRQLVATPSAVYMSGEFSMIHGNSLSRLAVVDPFTAFPLAFNCAPDDLVNTFLPLGDVVLAAGWFHNIGGAPRSRMACLDASSGSANGFNPTIGTLNPSLNFNALASSGSTLAVAGGFSDFQGQLRQYIAVLRDQPRVAIGDRVRGELNSTTVATTLTITLSFASTDTVRVDWTTADSTATAGSDYAIASGTVQFLPGETSKTISVGIMGDTAPEATEIFMVVLSNPVKANFSDALGLVTITDDDASDLVCRNQWATDGTVNAMNTSGTTLYIGGTFTRVGAPTGGGAPIDASTGLAIARPRANREVTAAGPDGSGGWYIGGDFSHVGGIPRSYLAQLASDGNVMPWDPGANGTVRALLVVGDTVYVGGDFTSVGGVPRRGVASFHRVSGALTTWNPAIDGRVWSLAARNGVVYAGGSFGFAGGRRRNGLAAIHAVTGAVTDWDANAGNSVLALQADDAAIYAGGVFTGVAGVGRRNVARISSMSGKALPFNPSPNAAVAGLALSGSRLFVAGGFDSLGVTPRRGLAAIDTSTGVVDAWNPNVNGTCMAVAVSGSTVFTGGIFSAVGGISRGSLAAIDANSAALLPWNPDANLQVNSLAVSNGVVFAGGPFNLLGATPRNRLAALDRTTGAVLAFDPNVNNTVLCMTRSKTRLFIGGDFTQVSGVTRNRLASVDATTGGLLAWNPIANNSVLALESSDTTIYAGGAFTIVGSGALPNRSRAARFGEIGGALLSWNPNASANVNTIRESGGLIYLGGAFTSIGGQPRNKIASVQATSGAFTAWDPNANGDVTALVPGNGVIYAGGAFTTIGGQNRNRLAAVSIATGNATVWNPDVSSNVNALAFMSNRLAAGGSFGFVGNVPRARFAVLDTATAGLVSGNLGLSGPVNAIVTSGTTTYAGGQFSEAGNVPVGNLSCIYLASPVAVELPLERGVLDLRLSPNPTRVTTTIEFELATAAHVKVDVFDVAGRHVARVLDGNREAGRQSVAWNVGGKVGAGVYYVRLETAGRTLRRSLVLLQ